MGLIMGSALNWYAYTQGFFIGNIGMTGILIGERIFGYPTVNDAVQLTILTFIITLLAGLLPAVMAARMEPVEALQGRQ